MHSGVLQGRPVGELVDPYIVALLKSLSHFASRSGGVQWGGDRHQWLQLGLLRSEGNMENQYMPLEDKNYQYICLIFNDRWSFHTFRVPPVSAIAATTSFSAYAVHQSAKGSWHQLRTWAPNGRRESTLSAATPRYRFFGVYRPLRPLVSTVHPSSTPSGRSTCIPSRWWDVERAASSLWLWIRTSSFLINQKLRCQSESKWNRRAAVVVAWFFLNLRETIIAKVL